MTPAQKNLQTACGDIIDACGWALVNCSALGARARIGRAAFRLMRWFARKINRSILP